MFSIKTVSTYILLVLFIGAASAGIALLVDDRRSGSPGVEILLPTVTPTPQLAVHVSGAVASPGVFNMKQGDRLVDVIAAAGGATSGARLSCVNLALKVRDEAHFHVPGPEEPCEPSSAEAAAQGTSGIDLNTASMEHLKSLPGIGEVKAQAIVDYRDKVGPFRSIEQVMEVKGIGPATHEAIRDLVYVTGAPP